MHAGFAPAAAPVQAPLRFTPGCGTLGDYCCAVDLGCDEGLVCDFFAGVSESEAVCVPCGMEGSLCCVNDDDTAFSCGSNDLVCDFSGTNVPICMQSAPSTLVVQFRCVAPESWSDQLRISVSYFLVSMPTRVVL